MGEGEVRVPWNVGVCAPGAGTGAGLCCSSLRSATQHSNAYQWWCGFRNYHLPPLLDHAHAPYFFSTQLLARNLASFCSLSLLLLPHLWTVVGTRARAGSWSLSSTRTRQPSPPSTVPALRSLRLCPRCLVAWLLGCLLPCLLGVAPALHRHHCPVCDRSSRHPSTHPSLGHPSLILASPPDNSVRRNRVSSVLISWIRLLCLSCLLTVYFSCFTILLAVFHCKGLLLALVVVPSSPCRCPSYLQHPYRRQLDQDRRSPGALPSRVSISISVPLTASRPIPPWPRPCCWLLCTHSRLPPCLGWTASVASFPDRVQAAQQPTAASRDTATASPANTARAFPAFVGSAGDEYRLLLLLLLLYSNETCLGWPASSAVLCGRWAGCRRRAFAAFLLEAVCTLHVGWCCSRPDATTHAVRPVCRLSSRCPSTPPPCFRLGTKRVCCW